MNIRKTFRRMLDKWNDPDGALHLIDCTDVTISDALVAVGQRPAFASFPDLVDTIARVVKEQYAENIKLRYVLETLNNTPRTPEETVGKLRANVDSLRGILEECMECMDPERFHATYGIAQEVLDRTKP